MPRLPMPPTNEENYQKNTKEQYEMLGRFIESFELMVNEVREICLTLAARDGRNAALIETILHYHTFTAKPLFDVLRCLVAEVIKDSFQEHEDRAKGITNAERPLLADANGNPFDITIKDRDTIFGVLTFIFRHYDDLSNQRNDLLHGTWYIGYVSRDDPNSDQFFIRRFKATKQGLSPVARLPKTAAELKSLRDQCERVRTWLAYVEEALQTPSLIGQLFEFRDQKWWLDTGHGTKMTLP